MDELAANDLAKASRGAMVAAAGFGKTHAIAKAIAEHTAGRELVLTHTHAGVDALRRHLADFGAPRRTYHVDTIAGWALRLAAAFPKSSGLPTAKPRKNAEYASVYAAATHILGARPIRDIMQASFCGVYVDEYQDCTTDQHGLVTALADVLKCRVIGDPLQGIFEFGQNQTISWQDHVVPFFGEVSGPTTPWRWKKTNPVLGEWLQDARGRLLAGRSLDLQGAPVQWVALGDPRFKQLAQRNACFSAAKRQSDTVIAIHKWPAQCHDVARGLNGAYSCVEAIDSGDFYEAANGIESADGLGRTVVILDFASKCMTQVGTELSTIREAFNAGRIPRVRKHVEVRDSLCALTGTDWIKSLPAALDAIGRLAGATVYRREIWRDMAKAVAAVAAAESPTLTEAAWVVRNRGRVRGRQLPRCAIGTTLLVKGLQFDHAVVLDADGYDAKNLYVALTRGAKSLTILSAARTIAPKPSIT